MMSRRRARQCGIAFLAVLAAAPAAAQPIASLRYAPDITVDFGNTQVGAGVLARDDLQGGVDLVDLGTLPSGAHVTAAHRFDNGNLLLSFYPTVALGGAGFVDPRDIVVFDAALHTFSLAIQGSEAGIPDGAHIDGLARLEDGTTLLSLDTSVGDFDDEDILRFDGPGLALYLDLSAIGDGLMYDPEHD